MEIHMNGNQDAAVLLEEAVGHTNGNIASITQDLSKKKEDYINWDDYFMAVAFLSAKRSKDPCTQVGACIVNQDNRIVGIGYNGMPRGCSDDDFPWGKRSSNPLENKYMYVCHAEMNAILNKITADLKGCRIFTSMFPCNECAKIIIQSGITEVVYFAVKGWEEATVVASRRLLDAAKVTYTQHEPVQRQVVIDFDSVDVSKMNQMPSPRK